MVNDDLVHEIEEGRKRETYPEVTHQWICLEFLVFFAVKSRLKNFNGDDQIKKGRSHTKCNHKRHLITGGILSQEASFYDTLGRTSENFKCYRKLRERMRIVRRWPRDVDPGSGGNRRMTRLEPGSVVAAGHPPVTGNRVTRDPGREGVVRVTVER